MLKVSLKYLCIIILMLGFIISCNNKKTRIEDQDLKYNLIDEFINKGKNSELSNEERVENLEKAYGIYSTLKDNSMKVEKIHQISFAYYSLKDFENYKKFNEKALELSKSINDSLKIAESYGYLGIYYRVSELDNAYKNFYQAEKIYSSINLSKYDKKEIAFEHGRILIDLARVLQRTKNYSESEKATIRAIESFNKAENEKFLSICYTNLGILAKYMERFDEAIDYHLKAIEYDENTKDEILQKTISYNNIGTTYKSQKKYNKAKEYYNKALLSHTEFLEKNPKRKARLIDNLAYVNFLSNDTTQIPELFYKALKIRDSIDDKNGIATNTLHLAEYYQSINKDSISKVYAEQSKGISLELQKNEELLRVYKLLSEVSNKSEGLEYANQYIKLNDSLVKQERLFRDKFARIRFETDQIVEENIQISKENQILLIAILGLTTLSLLGYIIFRQQQSNKELLFAQTQQEANEEIYRLLLNQQIKLEEGRQLEQQRMSEELHDGVLGRLFGVRLSLDGINQRANDGFTDARNKYIEELKSIEKEIRLISHDLGAETLPSDVAYIDAVETLIKDLCGVHKIEYEFNSDENIDWESINDQKKVNLFRILQESLQNIFKHAKANIVKISFDYVDDKINLTILDDGIGFKTSKVKKGIGLKNIASRVSQMSGVVNFLSTEDSGTTVSVSIPL
ncbi:tetratricopeptide repeat-containing sensor histidine kinase [Aquimarina algicola]|uniref:histidine kinase n=1 Tax=Aquimarina algicola TaxID=2589995 RepID=A0A504J6J4_9FLAO|nr:tetratricopeptide repeat-containing sensor histidine kinase [Aquimarina algicola]TPN82330.1 tetratricopeptide repeat protein [Aquimarina algicola]